MGVLLDTNVLSEMARPKPDAKVTAYLREVTAGYVSVITLHELRHGAELVKDRTKRQKLRNWLQGIEDNYESHLLPVSAEIAELAAVLRAKASGRGRVLHIEDAMIAATAMAHDMELATRNIKDFDPTGVKLINPWDSAD